MGSTGEGRAAAVLIGLWTTALAWIGAGVRDVMFSRAWDAVTARREQNVPVPPGRVFQGSVGDELTFSDQVAGKRVG